VKATDWLLDALECADGEHGEWWQQRFERAFEDGADHWWQWRDIRQNERPPGEVAGL
jgi:hypothetical protein